MSSSSPPLIIGDHILATSPIPSEHQHQHQQQDQDQQQQQHEPKSQEKKQTSATDRGLAQMNFKNWLFYVGVAAAIKTSILHPLTVAMARKRVLEEHASLYKVLFHPEKLRKCQEETTCNRSMLERVKKASLHQRIRFIYRGFGIAVFANIFGEMIYFAILEYVRYSLEGGKFDSFRNSIGGSGAELVSLTLATPLSVLCHRQMTSGFGVAAQVKYGTAPATFRDVVYGGEGTTTTKKGEYRRLFAGLSVALTALPAAAIWWGLYTTAKEGLYTAARNRNEQRQQSSLSKSSSSSSSSSPTYFSSISSSRDNPLINGASGVTASVLTTFLFNPFNVVRTRMQSGSMGNQSAVAVARLMLKNEGPKSFMKGVVVSSSSAALEGSILSSVYEYTKWLSDSTVWKQKQEFEMKQTHE